MVIQKPKLLVEEANVLFRRIGSLLFCIFKLDTAAVYSKVLQFTSEKLDYN